MPKGPPPVARSTNTQTHTRLHAYYGALFKEGKGLLALDARGGVVALMDSPAAGSEGGAFLTVTPLASVRLTAECRGGVWATALGGSGSAYDIGFLGSLAPSAYVKPTPLPVFVG